VISELVFPAQVALAFITMGLLARWYIAPRLARLPRDVALQPLLAVHTFRYIGLVFLAPAAAPSLAQSFAMPAGLGTAIAGVLALGSIALLRAHSRFAIPLIWIFSIEGLADFANAFAQARSATVVNQLGAAYYVPIVIVPAAVIAHLLIIGLLLRARPTRAAPATR
jgi:hypothetical protein